MKKRLAASFASVMALSACQSVENFAQTVRGWGGDAAANANASVAEAAPAEGEASVEPAAGSFETSVDFVDEDVDAVLDAGQSEQAYVDEDAGLEVEPSAAPISEALGEDASSDQLPVAELEAEEELAPLGEGALLERPAQTFERSGEEETDLAALAPSERANLGSVVEAGYRELAASELAEFLIGRAFVDDEGAAVAYGPEGRRMHRSDAGELYESRWRLQDGQFCEETAPAIWDCHVGERFFVKGTDLRLFDARGLPVKIWKNTARVE